MRILHSLVSLLLLLCLLVAVSCHSKSYRARTNNVQSPQATQEPLPLSPVGKEIESRGYRLKESKIFKASPWEMSTFRLREKQSFSFKAVKPQPDTNDTFCRFTYFVETYDSDDEARNRLAKLTIQNPDTDGEYLRGLRAGFRVGMVVHIFQTDATRFWDEVERLARTIARATPGAEMNTAFSN